MRSSRLAVEVPFLTEIPEIPFLHRAGLKILIFHSIETEFKSKQRHKTLVVYSTPSLGDFPQHTMAINVSRPGFASQWSYKCDSHSSRKYAFRTFFSAGEHDQTVTEGNEQVLDVAAVCYHESFALRHLRHDIAVLTLSKPAPLSDKVNTVCLPQSGQQVAPGTRCYITGKAK